MKLSELLNQCAASSRDDWNVIGPIEGKMHASYIPNVAIGLAWGVDEGAASFDEDWVPKAPDGTPGVRSLVDFLYFGHAVDQQMFVSVDGYRCDLPIPRRTEGGGWSVSRFQHDFFRVLDSLEKLSEYDRYFGRAGFEIREEG